jgi:putative flippase GtrA
MASIGTEARKRIVQTVRFAAVGICATALYFFLGLALVTAHIPLFWAHWIAYAVSIVFSYLGQKIFTFGVRGEHRRMGPRFLAATGVLAATQFALVAILKQTGAADILTLGASTIYYPIASFFVHTFWTFRAPAQAPTETDAQ